MTKKLEELLPLYTECEKCDGSGTWRQSSQDGPRRSSSIGPCPDCESIGAIPSEEGKRVLELVRRWRQAGRL
jgi:hypothetical protein